MKNNDRLIAELVDDIISKKADDKVVMSITIGHTTYDVWQLKNGSFDVLKSVLPTEKTSEKDFHKKMKKKEFVKMIVSSILKKFDSEELIAELYESYKDKQHN